MYARGEGGKFVKGTMGGPGASAYAAKALHFKKLIMDSVTDEELVAVIKALVAQAMSGNVRAAQELLDRLAGRPEQTFVDNTPAAPEITAEQFEKALADMGYVRRNIAEKTAE